MHHLLLMNVSHCVGHIDGYAAKLLGRRGGGKEAVERHTIDPLAHQTHRRATMGQFHRFHAHDLHDGRMLQAHENLQLLAQHLAVGLIVLMLRAQTLQQIPSPIPLGTIQGAIAFGAQLLNFAESGSQSLILIA